MIYMPRAESDRHNRFAATLMNRIFSRVESGEIHALQEQCPLVHYGTKDLPSGFELVDAKNIRNMERFLVHITELEYVNPDFMLFKDNPYVRNKKGTRTAGQPDLIVEIWSDSNTDNNRAFLKKLYETSPVTEHWYIEQEFNDVQCYIGRKQLPSQYLTDILVTQKGLEFDLRYLAV